jgi:hypothetical protein
MERVSHFARHAARRKNAAERGACMNDLFTTYEFVVAQKAEGSFLRRRILFILMYIAYVTAFLTVGIITRIGIPLVALVPVTTWILIFFTWRYVQVEYEYSITSGILVFTEIYGGRSRKKIMEVHIKDASAILPLDDPRTEAQVDRFAPEVVHNAIPSKRAEDTYVMLYVDEKDKVKGKGVNTAFTFVATTQALKVMKYYNSLATTVVDVSR